MPKSFFYACKVGRDGPQIYSTWPECERATKGFSHAKQKKFAYREDAEAWLQTRSPPRGNLRELSNMNLPSSSTATTSSSTLAKTPSSEDDGTPASGRSSAATFVSAKEVISLLDDSEDEGAAMGPPDPSFKAQTEVIELLDDSDIDSDLEVVCTSNVVPRTVGPPSGSSSTNGGPPTTAPEPPKQLSPQQQAILEVVLSGESVFFTGSAGTGKSFLLKEIIRRLPSIDGGTGVTASTGIAAVAIGGCTLHSWAGIGLGKEDVRILLKKLGRESKNRWQTTKTLIIDEISMVDGTLLDKLDEIGQALRGRGKPFGGIQLVLCGDFFQLPPVPDEFDNIKRPIVFAFDAKCWKHAVPNCLTLTHVFRQKEQEFIDILNEARLGRLNAAGIEKFRKLSRPLTFTDGIEPTQLFSLRDQVQKANDRRLAALRTPPQRFIAKDFPGYNHRGEPISQAEATKKLDRNVMAPAEVILKVGCQVMLIKNMSQSRLVNGSIGIIKDFQTPRQARETGHDVARADDLTPDAKQRGRSQQESLGHIDPRELAAYQWPLVEFTNPLTNSKTTLLVQPAEFSVVNVFGRTEAQRDQVPLILAWAMSIHKSQGQSLARVKVDLSTVFEKGQAYVALSRAMTLEGLQVKGFSPDKVKAHPRVIEWAQTLTVQGENPEPTDEERELWDDYEEDEDLILSYQGPY